MGCRGVLFAIEDETVRKLLGAESDDDVMEIVEAVEEAWDGHHLMEVDKSWDAMHRALSDGSLDHGKGEYPLNHALLGGRHLHGGDNYVVVLIEKSKVSDIADALSGLDEAAFRDRYERIVPHDYAPEYGEEDFAYTWENLLYVAAFYQRAATTNRSVIFTVDQ